MLINKTDTFCVVLSARDFLGGLRGRSSDVIVVDSLLSIVINSLCFWSRVSLSDQSKQLRKSWVADGHGLKSTLALDRAIQLGAICLAKPEIGANDQSKQLQDNWVADGHR